MARKQIACVVCGRRVWGRGNSLYCGDNCKAKAYRARKKQIKISRQHTMTIDEYPFYEKVIQRSGHWMQHALDEILLISRRDTWKDVLINLSTLVTSAYDNGAV